MQNARRASFSARPPIETCDRLKEQGFIDLHYTSDRSDNGIECVEFQVYETDGKGVKLEDPVRDARKAEREAARARRNSLLITFHFNLGRDLLMLLATSPIFDTIKQNIPTTRVYSLHAANTAPLLQTSYRRPSPRENVRLAWLEPELAYLLTCQLRSATSPLSLLPITAPSATHAAQSEASPSGR